MTRSRVYIQVFDQRSHRWNNYVSFRSYDEAVKNMKALQESYPEAKLRILDNNLSTHTK